MDLRNIQTFIQVAQQGSFTKAAEELQYVQSTVSMQIQQLERELGFPLFDRIGKKVSLTALGAQFLNYAYKIMQAMQEASNLDKHPGDIRGTLRLGVLESLLFGNMLQLLPRFKEVYTNLDLRLKMGQTTELLQQLKQNQLDMVYLSSDLNADPELCCYYKRREHLIFVCNPGHSVASKKIIGAQELFEQDFIVTEHSGICYGRLQRLAQQHHAVLHTSIEVDSTVAIATLLRRDMSLAFLPEYSVQKQLEKGSIVRINVDLEPQIYYSQILGHKNRWLSPFMIALIERIRNAYPERE